MALRKNQIVELQITGMTTEGSGVGRADGMAVFVYGAAVDDVLRVKLIKIAGNYAVGRIEEVITPSADRQETDCAVAVSCGGCVYRHITYEAELRIKQQKVADALTRIGGFTNLPIRPIVGAAEPNYYRNKAQLPVGYDANGKLCVGFFAARSHRVVPCTHCYLQPQAYEEITQAFLAWAESCGAKPYDETTHSGLLRHLCIRQAGAMNQRMVCIVANGTALPQEEKLVAQLRAADPTVCSIVLNENKERTNVIMGQRCRTLWGTPTITDRLCGLEFSISPLSFYQVNRDQAERLYEIAADYAELHGNETLLDLYCGTGTIGLSMAGKVGKLYGAEIVAPAVADAKRNAERNHVKNAEFFCADAAEAAAMLAKRQVQPQVVVVDPPRKGCSTEVLEIIAQQLCPQRLVYVSCDPATLARDLKYLVELGYTPQEVTPVDMFPRTAHVESVVCLTRSDRAP